MVAIPGLEGITASGSWGQIITVVEYFLVAAILGGLAYFLGNIARYDTRVEVIEKRGKTGRVSKPDLGRVIKDKDGNLMFRLFKHKETLPLPNYEYIIAHGGLWLKKKVNIQRDGERTYTFCQAEYDDTGQFKIRAIEQDLSNITRLTREQLTKFDARDFMQKWGTLIISGIMLIILLGTIVMENIHSEKLASQYTSAGDSFKYASDNMLKAAKALDQCYVPSGYGSAIDTTDNTIIPNGIGDIGNTT